MSEKKSSFWSSLAGMLTGLAALIAAIVGLITVLGSGNSDDPSKSPPVAPVAPSTQSSQSAVRPTATIIDPRRGDGVCLQQRVRGTTTGVPESSDLWLFVYAADEDKYYPADQARRASRGGKTTWSATADFGTQNRQSFTVIIASADRSAADVLAHVRPGSGLPRMPPGTKRLDDVPVTTTEC